MDVRHPNLVQPSSRYRITDRLSFKVFKAYTTSTSAYLALEALPLILTPKLIVSMVAAEPRRITDLETYLCRSFGLSLLTLSILVLLLTGILPVGKTVRFEDDPDSSSSKDPYAYPTLVVTLIYHAITAFYLYTQLTYGWNFAFTCGLAGSSGMFCMGLWIVLFGSERGRISKKTGADKRTSNFPFVNAESATAKKKEHKRKSSGARTRSGT